MLAHLRALALLGFALLGPAALPAGGGERRQPELRRRQRVTEPLTAPGQLALRCAPQREAPVISRVARGESLRLLRRWCPAAGERWLQVEWAGDSAACVRRGWLLES